jgi:hypothetical protein
MTNRTEAQLRLDTLTRNLDKPASGGGEVVIGVAVAVGLAALVLLQVVLFSPVVSAVAGR